jgi:hypothetical protein
LDDKIETNFDEISQSTAQSALTKKPLQNRKPKLAGSSNVADLQNKNNQDGGNETFVSIYHKLL